MRNLLIEDSALLRDSLRLGLTRAGPEVETAEDVAQVLARDAQVSVPYGTFADCLTTQDWTPIEPFGAVEHKSYAPGIELVQELKPATGAKTVLVSVSMQP
jgi:ActR/RegA family two-component response regulator